MKKSIYIAVIMSIMGIAPMMTSCRDMIDEVIGVPDTPTETVHVTGISVTGEGVEDGAATLTVGSTLQLTATASPADTKETGVSWKTGDSSVATVDANGLVTAVAAGTATVTAVSQYNASVAATVAVTVVDGTVGISDTPVSQSDADSRQR